MNRPDVNILRSVLKNLEDAFVSGGIMGTAYAVGSDADMRAGTALAFPYIYLLNFGRLFQVEHLPVIIVQLSINSIAFEMGSGEAPLVDLNLHIFGRDAMQTANIKAGLRKQIDSWHIYDFDLPNTPEVQDCDIICDEQGSTWTESFHSIANEGIVIEASLASWSTMSCAFQVTEGD